MEGEMTFYTYLYIIIVMNHYWTYETKKQLEV